MEKGEAILPFCICYAFEKAKTIAVAMGMEIHPRPLLSLNSNLGANAGCCEKLGCVWPAHKNGKKKGKDKRICEAIFLV